VLDNYPLHRPYEIPPLILFLIALFYFYKRQLYKKNDVFYKGIVGSILIDAFAQLIMSYSTASFDTAHNVAHILKDSAYFVNIVGLALSSINYNLRLKESNDNLVEINARLREREELIRIQYDQIKGSSIRLEQANEQLKAHDKMQKEFINIAAHELKTPIQPILSLTGILRFQINNVGQQELIEAIVRNAKRLQRLSNDILDVTKIEGRSLELHTEDFNLNDVVINAINDITLGRDFHKKEILKLSFNPDRDILIKADKARISQVISNLLNNAIEFTVEGTIDVSIEQDKISNNNNNYKTIIVSVKDSGQGIDQSILPRLFTKFASKSYKGTGLGLFISKGIIEAHGGTIWGENNSDGRGATFTFSLPTN
jgi:signal transduction histidine kinase